MDLIQDFKKKAKADPQRIVFPEGTDYRILQAAQNIVRHNIASPIVLGEEEKIKHIASEKSVNTEGIRIILPTRYPKFKKYISMYCKMRNSSEGVARRILRKPLFFGSMMVKSGEADGMVAGAVHPTADVITAGKMLIGLKEGIEIPSSFFIMDIPRYEGSEEGLLVFADAAVNPLPDAQELASIALATAESVKNLLNWQPRIAMLSFSTKGSASHPQVDKVAKATEIIKEESTFLVDGELQADAALVPEVADRKIEGESPVGGKANVLIFPDLDAANISYKLVQRLANAAAYGPILQGFVKPISDLSRGATVEDVIGATAIVAVKAQSD